MKCSECISVSTLSAVIEQSVLHSQSTSSVSPLGTFVTLTDELHRVIEPWNGLG